MKRTVLGVVLFGLSLAACRPVAAEPEVVIYTSVDQHYSEPILQLFEQETGIQVKAVYDVEAAKTTGLVNRLLAEKDRPLADVFWNGEFAQTIALQQAGVLAPYRSPNAADVPPPYRDPTDHWTGFAGRARVILINTERVFAGEYPDSINDFSDPRWPGDQLGIAYPLFGTTATQAAALYAHLGPTEGRSFFEALAQRDVTVLDGNSVVRDQVAAGQLIFGLTDTDDACGAIVRGAPVEIVFPDQGANEMGTLIIPNTVALVAGGPNPDSGRRLIDYLLSRQVAAALIESGWSHVTLRPIDVETPCLGSAAVKGMDIDLAAVNAQLEYSKQDLTEIFVR